MLNKKAAVWTMAHWQRYRMDSHLEASEMDPDSYAPMGMVFYLFGIFCAYWAQITNRNAWLWFFGGWFLAPITGPVLLHKNSRDRQAEPGPE